VYYIYDVNGYVDDFATQTTINDIRDIAISKRIKALINFFDEGYYTNLKELEESLNSIEWPEIDFIRATVEGLKNSLFRCKEIIIIHDAYE